MYFLKTVLGISSAFAFMGILDILIAKPYFKKARWFALHALGNTCVAAMSFPAICMWIADPLYVVQYVPGSETFNLWHPMTMWPTYFAISIHLYHLLCFNNIKSEDLWHHYVFVSILSIYGGLMLKCGPIRNVCAFYMTGFPGGIDYYMLVAEKYGFINKLTEKKINTIQHSCIRMPGILSMAGTAWMGYIYTDNFSITSTLIICGFSTFNAIYYMQQVVGNYYVTKYKMEQANRKQNKNLEHIVYDTN